MRRYSHVLCLYILVNASFLECVDFVTLDSTYIPRNLHLPWNYLHLLRFSVVQWCLKKFRTVLKYSSIWSDVLLYIKTSSTIIIDDTLSVFYPFIMCPIPFLYSSLLSKILELHSITPWFSPSVISFHMGWIMPIFIVYILPPPPDNNHCPYQLQWNTLAPFKCPSPDNCSEV